MISISVWKAPVPRVMCRPANGPASHGAQPPLRAGTYCDGSPAAPALVRKTVTTTPSSPSSPSARAVLERSRVIRRRVAP
jgi:hypothetical protein